MHIYIPNATVENVGTWRGPFEPSTVTFSSERKRVAVEYIVWGILP